MENQGSYNRELGNDLLINHLENLEGEIQSYYHSKQNELLSVTNADELEIFEETINIQSNTFSRNIMNTRFENQNTNSHVIMRRIDSVADEFYNQFFEICDQIFDKRLQLQKGLSLERIEQFEHFEAVESLVGEQCTVCMEDFEVGKRLMRLDCGGRHVFCQVCIEGWFANHKTCPLCRHSF